MKKCLHTAAQEFGQRRHRYLRGLLIAGLAFFMAVAGIFTDSEPVEAAAPRLNRQSASINEGKSVTLTVRNASAKVTWSTSNPRVVRITKRSGAKSSKATLKGVKAGKARITAKVGKKRLTAVITVKHVHRWRGYATCTSKDTCRTCGAQRGRTMPHDWMRATCQRPETCAECGRTRGGRTSHSYGADNFCSMCRQRNLHAYMSIYIPNYSIGMGDLMYFDLITNTNIYTRVFANDPQGYGTATAYDAHHRMLKRMIAWENNAASTSLQLSGGAGTYTFCLRSSDFASFRFPSDGSIEFELWFASEHYRISVKCSNDLASNYTFTRLP